MKISLFRAGTGKLLDLQEVGEVHGSDNALDGNVCLALGVYKVQNQLKRCRRPALPPLLLPFQECKTPAGILQRVRTCMIWNLGFVFSGAWYLQV